MSGLGGNILLSTIDLRYVISRVFQEFPINELPSNDFSYTIITAG